MESIYEALGSPFIPIRLSLSSIFYPFLHHIFLRTISTAVLRLLPSVWRACTLLKALRSMTLPLELQGTTKREWK